MIDDWRAAAIVFAVAYVVMVLLWVRALGTLAAVSDDLDRAEWECRVMRAIVAYEKGAPASERPFPQTEEV